MTILDLLSKWLQPGSARQTRRQFELDEEVLVSLEQLAAYRGSTPRQVAAEIVSDALTAAEVEEVTWKKWQSLTPREQQVVALVCLNYQTRQIAESLDIAPETVRSHVRNALKKFELPNRQALRYLLQDWDFSSWQ